MDLLKKIVKVGSQFNQNKKAPAAPKPTDENKRQLFDGSDEPKADPVGGDCHCISPDGIIKRDGYKRFGF